MAKTTPSTSERRSFLTRLNSGAASLAALALGGAAIAQVKSAPATKFEPTRHDQDNWMDEVPGKHRMVIDTTNSPKFGDALLFANNFFTANRTDYGLENKDIAVIVVARHQSTSLAYNDEMWAKYGVSFAGDLPAEMRANPPKVNSNDAKLASLAKLGVQFAVCSMATRRIAGIVARATNGNADTIFAELTSHLIANARMAPAGIIAVSRAQERGYTLVSA
jgi:intracellular sulfur oxidation DsrE/DsrF family protein